MRLRDPAAGRRRRGRGTRDHAGRAGPAKGSSPPRSAADPCRLFPLCENSAALPQWVKCHVLGGIWPCESPNLRRSITEWELTQPRLVVRSRALPGLFTSILTLPTVERGANASR